jgi:hypothetical protein
MSVRKTVRRNRKTPVPVMLISVGNKRVLAFGETKTKNTVKRFLVLA